MVLAVTSMPATMAASAGAASADPGKSWEAR